MYDGKDKNSTFILPVLIRRRRFVCLSAMTRARHNLSDKYNAMAPLKLSVMHYTTIIGAKRALKKTPNEKIRTTLGTLIQTYQVETIIATIQTMKEAPVHHCIPAMFRPITIPYPV
jgi:hypothetical protein